MARLVARCVLLAMAAALLAGCSRTVGHTDLLGLNNEPPRQAPACEADADPEQNVKLDLIRKLMDSGKLYAALAHLEATRSKSPRSTYLRAEILRQTDRTEQAEPLYRELLGGCLAGKGYHGLGLIAGRDGKIPEALAYLHKAEAELPIDVKVRNDLGYALLLDGQFEAARNEFLTALELDGSDPLSATNMALLLAVTGKEREMQAFALHMNMDPETVAQLRAQAEEIKAAIDKQGRGPRSVSHKL